MKLTRNVGQATFIQFGIMSILAIPAGLNSVVTTCSNEKGDCVSNLLVSFVLYILIVLWFGAVAALGFATQEKRRKSFAVALIFAELMIAFIAHINARGHTDPLSLVTSIVDLALAVWIIFLATRIFFNSKGRIVSKSRARKRRPPTTEL